MTTEQLRQIAEACGYEVREHKTNDSLHVYDEEGEWLGVLPMQCSPYETYYSEVFRPHIDANQAIECLNRRFGKDGHPVWTCERYRDKCTVYGLLDSWVEGEPADSFPLAACNAILESLK